MGKLYTCLSFIARHKYLVTICIYLLVIGLFDENSLYDRWCRNKEISRMRQERDEWKAQYDEDTRRLNSLQDDPEAIERMLREKYFLCRADEEVFVFQKEQTEEEESK